MFMTSLLTITPWPVLSAAILLVLLIAALYLARHTAHQAIHAVTSALARGFRLASHSVAHAEERLAARNREVLLNAGRDAKERMVEREFARIADTTRKDLSNYPDMHRRLSEAIIRIEEDQEKAVEVPPEAPGWAKAVEVIAKLDARNAGADILADIHKSMVKAHAEAMADYRKASGERPGARRDLHRRVPHRRYRSARHHHGRDLHGSVSHGVVAHHTAVSRDRRSIGQNARAHDRDYVRDPAADGEYRSGPRVHARSTVAGRAGDQRAAPQRQHGSARKRASVDHHDGTDGHGFHPAIRARVCRHTARDLRALAAHRGGPHGYRGAAGARPHPARSR